MARPPFAVAGATAFFLIVSSARACLAATVTVDPTSTTHSSARLLLGQSFGARASFRLASGPVGYYSPTTGQPLDLTPGTGMTWMWEHLDQTSLRYPQGPVNTWQWKSTIGPIALRATQPYQPYPNKAAFGLDEFMAMSAAQGVTLDNVHMMVNIYGDVYNKNKTQAIQDAADLVSYLNATTGPWAAQRTANGHASPYGVKLFNLGNEPWTPSTLQVEYNYLSSSGAASYAADSLEFIAAMKAMDPTIQITLSATSPRPNTMTQAVAWNQTLIDTCGDDIYALVTNTYYDSTFPQQYGVKKAGDFIDGIIDQVDTFNASHTNQLHVIVGEHGNSITSGAGGNTDANFAMQWQAAVTTADYLGMLTQKPEVERAHSFIWGNGAAVWHPMRLDGYDATGNPIYTFLPVVGMADALDDVFMDTALALDTVSPGTANGLNAYSISASAFLSDDGQSLTMMLVNIDAAAGGSQLVDLVGTDGFALESGQLLTGATPNAESFTTTSLAVSSSQTPFSMLNQSVMLLQFHAVPEPGAMVLLASAAVGFLAIRLVRGRGTRSGSSCRS